ncbi:hypothetical protein [Lactiplantibacillus songbeiensis]|nr:hypothetical protein [Lactiplantibacillus songbeiensis]
MMLGIISHTLAQPAMAPWDALLVWNGLVVIGVGDLGLIIYQMKQKINHED